MSWTLLANAMILRNKGPPLISFANFFLQSWPQVFYLDPLKNIWDPIIPWVIHGYLFWWQQNNSILSEMKCWDFTVWYRVRSSKNLWVESIITNPKSQPRVENISGETCRQWARQLCSEDRFTKAFFWGHSIWGTSLLCSPFAWQSNKATLSFSSIQKKKKSSSLFLSCIRKQEKQWRQSSFLLTLEMFYFKICACHCFHWINENNYKI